MDKIDIKEFTKETCWVWQCPTCKTQSAQHRETMNGVEAVHCLSCGNTFEIVKQ